MTTKPLRSARWFDADDLCGIGVREGCDFDFPETGFGATPGESAIP